MTRTPSGFLQRAQADFDWKCGAIFAAPEQFETAAHRAGVRRAVIGVPVLRMFLAEVFRNQNLDWLIEQFFSGIAEHAFRLRVDQQHPPGAIHNDHGVGRCFQQTAEFFVPVAHTFIVVGSWLPGRNRALSRVTITPRDTHLAGISDKNRQSGLPRRPASFRVAAGSLLPGRGDIQAREFESTRRKAKNVLRSSRRPQAFQRPADCCENETTVPGDSRKLSCNPDLNIRRTLPCCSIGSSRPGPRSSPSRPRSDWR